MLKHKRLITYFFLTCVVATIILCNSIYADDPMDTLASVCSNYNIPLTQEGFIFGLKHKEMIARAASCKGLSIMGDLNAIGPLGDVAKHDAEPIIAISALKAINKIIEREIVPIAETLMEQAQSKADRFVLAGTLSSMGNVKYFREVLQVLRNPDDAYFVSAVRKVPDLAKYNLYDNGELINWVQELSSLLNKSNISSIKRTEILSALNAIGSKEALKIIANEK
jgi:hypothetical protein